MSDIGTPSIGLPLLQTQLIGNINSYYPSRIPFIVPGEAVGTVQNVKHTLWDGPTSEYVFPTTPIQMQVVSSSASDTAAGTGVQSIHIHYLDTNYLEKTTVVTLNGTTPVLTTPTDILRINTFHATAVGTAGDAVGNISVQSVGGAVTYGFLSAGHNRARMGIFTIPANKTGYIIHWQSSNGSPAGTHFVRVELEATTHDGILYPGVFIYQEGAAGQNSTSEVNLEIPIVLPAKCDIKLSAISDSATANATVVGNILGWYE